MTDDSHRDLDAEVSSTCLSCGAPQPGSFCSECGERRLRPDEFSLRRLLRDSLGDLFSLDARLWRSFRELFFRPGESTAAYMSGRRAGRLGPIQLFLTANVIYFLVQPITGFGGYNTSLGSHMDRQFYSESVGVRAKVEAEIDRRIEARASRALAALDVPDPTPADSTRIAEQAAAVERALYPTLFDTRGEVLARTLVFLLVPFYAVMLLLLHAGRAIPFVRHVVFAIHYQAWVLTFVYSIFLLALGLAARGVLAAIQAGWGMTPADVLATPFGSRLYFYVMEQGSLVVIFAYLFLAFQRAYGSGRIPAALRAAIVTVAGVLAISSYRLILFWTTFWTI